MQQVLFTAIERILRLGPAPRHFPKHLGFALRVAAALAGGLIVLLMAALFLTLLV